MDRNDTDGHRITYTDGAIVHLRPSGNAPELRVYVEADSDERADVLLAHALWCCEAGNWWVWRDLNPQPIGYEPTALTN